MNRQEFEIENKKILDKVIQTLSAKGVEYQKDEDVLSNFNSNALELNLSPFQIWSVYFTKHVKSIINGIKKNPKNPVNNNLSEPYEGRIIDAIAYLLLLNAMTKKQ
jgi:hypothetical protein